jgi:hypothetical protein
MVETRIPEYKPWAEVTELALNHFLKQTKFAERVLIPAARQSMMSQAVTRTSLVHHRNYERQEGVYKLGTPHTEVIDFINYLGDPTAHRREDFIFEGDQYSLPTEYAREFFGSKYADDIVADGKSRFYRNQDWTPHDLVEQEFLHNKDILALREFSTFIDLYLYDEGVIITIMPEGKTPRILRTVEWEGPEGGPYDVLQYKQIPNVPIALPPAWDWMDKDITVNLLTEKMRQQAEAQKDFIAVQGEEDGNKAREVPNNGIVTFDNLEALEKVSIGGVNPINFQWVDYILQQFQMSGGAANPVVQGAGTAADTLGQEQMVYNNATRVVSDMYNRFQDFANSILKKQAWAFWIEPTTYVPVIKERPGLGSIPVVFDDKHKVGEFYDFAFSIIPYSSQREMPATKFQKLMLMLSQWTLPTLQFAMAQGAQIDFNKINETIAHYLGVDSFDDWYKTARPRGLEGMVNYKMMPADKKNKSPQSNDAMGATGMSREGNMLQQQTRAGEQPSPSQATGQKQPI